MFLEHVGFLYHIVIFAIEVFLYHLAALKELLIQEKMYNSGIQNWYKRFLKIASTIDPK